MSEYEDEEYEKQQLEYLATNLPQFEIPLPLCESVWKSLEYNRLRRLNVKGSDFVTRFTDKEIISLIEAFNAANIRLEELSLPYHNITDVGFEEILRLLKPALYAESSSHLQPQGSLLSINVEGNDICGNTIDNSPLASRYDCSLISLNLSSNPLSQKGQYAVASVVLNNQVLKHLILDSCGFELNGLILLTSNLLQNESLQTLSINRPILNKIKEELVVDHFHRVLLSNRSLMNLSLKYFKIMDFGAKLLSESLTRNNSIISLNLECNFINVAGAEAIASYLLLKNTRCLEFLGLAFNEVGDDGAIAIADAIKSNTGLRFLTLKNNKIGPVGLEAIAKALETSINLESLTIFGNDFSNQNGVHFYDLIKHRLPYTNMYLDIQVYIVDGMYKIAEN